jgi:FkbM family methyltransferase
MVLPVLQGPLRGKKWVVGAHLHGCWLGSYEMELQKCIATEVTRGGVFYDVGANVGFYCLLAAAVVHPGRVYGFEPLPVNLGYLRRHLALNEIRNVEVFELAICAEVGTALFETEETRAAGRLGAEGKLLVRTSSLDALLREQKIAPPHCIKMDIEGGELHALLGAKECFSRFKPKLFLATHGRDVHDDCCRLLSDWRYDLRYASRESENRAELFAWAR